MLKNLILHAIVLLLSLILPKAYAAEGDNQRQRFIEDDKKEAKMVFYTSVETEFARALTSGFEATYPFSQTDICRSTDEKVLSRMNVERKTGTYTADTVSVGEFETYHLQQMGFTAPYKSPSAAAYPEGFKDPNGYWTDLYDNLIVTAYNTTRVKRDEMPKRSEDLLQSRSKRRMLLDQNEERWCETM